MQALDILLALPESLLALVLTSWLKVQDVGCMDAAICATSHRSEFLRQAYRHSLPYATNEFMDACNEFRQPYKLNGLMCWALARGAAVCTIRVNKELTTANKKREDYLRQNGSFVRKILFDENEMNLNIKTTLKDLLKYCPNVINFSCKRTLSVTDYKAFATRWPQLEAIRMCCGCHANSFRVIGQNCKNLKRFDGNYNQENGTLDAWIQLLTMTGATLESVRGEPPYQPFNQHLISVVAKCCPNLRSYEVKGIYLTPGSLRTLMENCPHLTSLETTNSRMADEGLQVLAELGTGLKTLILTSSGEFTDEGMVAMLKTCTQLQILDLYGVFSLSLPTFRAIGQYCPLLEELELSCQEGLTGAGLCAIARGCPRLRLVGIGGTAITNRGLADLLRTCPRLVSLGLDNCPFIDEKGLLSIPKLRPEIADLSIAHADISLKGLRTLAKGLKKLRYIDLEGCCTTSADLKGVFGPSVWVVGVKHSVG